MMLYEWKKTWLYGAALSCVALMLSGCTFSDSLRHNYIGSVWAQPPATRAVFFATDRETEGAGFGLHWSAALHCGKATLSLPAAWDRIDKTPAVSCDGETAVAKFARDLAAATREKNCNSVLLIVHGYNTTFRTALLQAAQVSMDTQWRCATLAFSWSSEGKFDRYVADIERSGYAVPLLTAVLREIGAAGLTVNVVAHSMGARITLNALGARCTEPLPVVNELILVAPDISAEHDNDDFGRLLKRDTPCVRRTTIYASDNDMALITSESVHGGIPRAGRVPESDLQYVHGNYGDNIDVVDASLAPGDPAGHGYFTLSYEMADGMMWVLAGLPTESRSGKGGPGTLICSDWKHTHCSDAGGRYALAVTPARQPDLGSRLVRHIWPLLFPIQ